MENPKPGPFVMGVFATYEVFLQAFFMGLLFFVAGYFVPGAFHRKGVHLFLRDRLVRLGLPSLFFMVVVQPVTIYWLLRNFADPSRPSLAQAYLPYLTSGRFLGGSGPMWFAVALLLFTVTYVILRKLFNPGSFRQTPAALPTHGQVIGLIIAMGLGSFLVRIVQPIGTNILNLQLCFFPQYIILFALGIYAWRRDWILRIPYQFGLRWFCVSAVLGSLTWVAFLVVLLKTHTEDKLSGGLTWQSAVYSFWEAFFCCGICLGLMVGFREKFQYRGRFARWLSANSFCVYMFHTPLLIAVTLALRGLEAPKLVKFACATILGVAVSFLASSLVLRRIPLLKRIL
jgi:surface polysaccharide O-acyltransferase-like enzyme